MEIEIASPNQKEKMMMKQYQAQAAPLAPQEKGVVGQMGDMAKQRAMKGALDKGQEGIMQGIGSMAGPSTAQMAGLNALAPATGGLAPGAAQAVMGNTALAGTTGASLAGGAGAGAGMAALGTAVPYIGAGMLAGKALGLFNEGGQVGPLNAQYAAGGYQIPNPNLSEARILNAYDKYLSKFNEPTGSIPNMAMPFDEFKLAIESQEAIKFDQGGKVGMTEADARALMNNQPNPDELYNEIVAESMTEIAQEQIPMPMPRPMLSVDPFGADTTSSPYDMIRPDNVPST